MDRRRPLAHELWLGPRSWNGAIRTAGIAAAARLVAAHGAAPSPLLLLAAGAAARQDAARASQPRAQLQRLGELVLMYARLIGRLRHRISDLHHAPDPAALSRAVERAVGTLHHLCDLEAEIAPSADDLAAAAAASPAAAAAAASPAAAPAATSPAAAPATAAGSGPPPLLRPSPLRVTPSDGAERPGGSGASVPATGAGDGGSGGGGGAHLPERAPPPPRPAPSAKLAAGGELHALCARCRPASARCAKRLAPLALPSHLSRHWVSYCAGGAALAAAATWALRSDTLLPLLRAWNTAAVDSASSFWREHVRGPAALLWRELVHRDYLQISDPRAAQRSSELLHELLAQFRETWASELQAAELRASAPALEDIGWAAAAAQGIMAAPAQGAAAAAQGAGAAWEGAGDAAAAVYGTGYEASAAVYGAGEAAVAAIQRRASDGGGVVHPGAAVAAGAAAAQAASEAVAAAAATTAAAAAASGASGTGGAAAAAMPRLIDIDAEMEAISRLFGMQLQSPAYNMVQGPLLQMLIIQAAYMKAAGLQQMQAMETLMRENFFTASISALVPGVGLMLAAGGGLKTLLRRLRSRLRSRRSLIKQMRTTLRDVERLLVASLSRHGAAPRDGDDGDGDDDGGGDGRGDGGSSDGRGSRGGDGGRNGAVVGRGSRLVEIESGLLVISVHSLRQALEKYRVLLAPGERQSFVEVSEGSE